MPLNESSFFLAVKAVAHYNFRPKARRTKKPAAIGNFLADQALRRGRLHLLAGIRIVPAGMWVSAVSELNTRFDTHTSWVPTVHLPAEDAPQSIFSMKTMVAVCEDRPAILAKGNWEAGTGIELVFTGFAIRVTLSANPPLP